ncbi:hypothetical protein ACWOAH_07675 [Vagococcus vulneris]|uniref:Uncharacterized protein n=1 Tax=Vagococcus vulneris TaxID=1977869 RepID=A0A429ZXV9_9ENTE|nr:hypothetical protein [Vagococcus vulneris]RST98734.1 hypothetical protein CBF37_06705 [Vagococcus vulneris]
MQALNFNISAQINDKSKRKFDKQCDIVFSKKPNDDPRYQLEIVWDNYTFLPKSFVLIVCRVVSKEWKRVFKKYPLYGSFIEYHSEGENRAYFSFTNRYEIADDVWRNFEESIESVYEECLNRVVERQQDLDQNGIQNEVGEPSETNDYKLNQENISDDYQKLAVKIENQEGYLDLLMSQVDKGDLYEQDSRERQLLQRIYGQIEKQRVQLTNLNALYQEIERNHNKNSQEEMERVQNLSNSYQLAYAKERHKTKKLTEKFDELTDRLKKSEDANYQLDQANLQLTAIVKEHRLDTEEYTKLKQIRHDMMQVKEESELYRQKAVKYEKQVHQLELTIENLEKAREQLRMDAQTDVHQMEESLSDMEVQLINELNEKRRLLVELKEAKKKIEELEIHTAEYENNILMEKKYYEKMEVEKSQLKDIIGKLKEQNTLLGIKIQQQDEELVKRNRDASHLTEQVSILDEAVLPKMKQLVDTYRTISLKSDIPQKIIDWIEEYVVQFDKDLKQVINQAVVEDEMNPTKVEISGEELEADADEQIQSTLEINDSSESQTIAESKRNVTEISWEQTPTGPVQATEDYEEFEDSYEVDPYVNQVAAKELLKSVSADQSRAEAEIKRLFMSLDSQPDRVRKILKSEYDNYLYEIDRLISRWNDVRKVDNIDKNTKFLEFCLVYMDYFHEFNFLLDSAVKEPFFDKRYVLIDATMLVELRAYSLLSAYLETYYLEVSKYAEQYYTNKENE